MQAHRHAFAYGGAAQLEVGYLTVNVTWPSAFALCTLPCSPVNAILPNPRTLDEYHPSFTGQPSIHHQLILMTDVIIIIIIIEGLSLLQSIPTTTAMTDVVIFNH